VATIVLVHGSTAGGWVWKDIALRLRDEDYEVYTPTLTGLGERVHLLTREVGLDTHITDIVNVLHYEDLHDVILVGHSLGGMIITGVADQVPERIAELVYLDALVPENGESTLDLTAPELRKEMEQRVRTEGEGWLVPIMRGPNDVGIKNTSHPWKVLTDSLTLKNKARQKIPCAYVRFSADKQLGEPYQLAMETSWQRAQAWGWQIYEVDTVHQILPDPEPKANILLSLVGSSA
jgi:pimeloyl-ACP methyl ester carboxylesterase